MKFTKKKLALAIGGALITMSVLVSGCGTGSDKKADTIKIGVVAEMTGITLLTEHPLQMGSNLPYSS